jgi:hypothetical protein
VPVTGNSLSCAVGFDYILSATGLSILACQY